MTFMNIVQALQFKWPKATWYCGEDYASLVWTSEDIAKPTEDDVNEAYIESVAYIDLMSYKSNRKSAYPIVSDQLDMQYHDSVNGTTLWKDTISAVKAQYPKPEGI